MIFFYFCLECALFGSLYCLLILSYFFLLSYLSGFNLLIPFLHPTLSYMYLSWLANPALKTGMISASVQYQRWSGQKNKYLLEKILITLLLFYHGRYINFLERCPCLLFFCERILYCRKAFTSWNEEDSWCLNVFNIFSPCVCLSV